jgi:hypothetical protein
MRKLMIGVLVTSLVAATTPLYAESASDTGPALSQEGVRVSIERAIILADAGAQAPWRARRPLGVSVQQQFASTGATPRAADDPQAVPAIGGGGGGGGGHKLATILTLVTTGVSVAGAAYYLKVLKKTTSQIPAN